ncbi:MAG: ABC transporter substrate-binding protein [Phycisphaerae bacterium]|nr:ABC transporter substrate-binding protein [Phycisphaerae bacterium]
MAVIAAWAAAGTAALLVIATGRGNGIAIRTERCPTAPAAKSAPYVVTMSPMGAVRFDHPPRRIVTMDANYNDMLVALGQDDRLIATGYASNFYDGFYAQLPGVRAAMDPQRLTYLAGAGGSLFDKELLYALHADIHHIDPLQLAGMRGWTRADVDEIARNVGPFFANRDSRENNYPDKEPYTYYTLWELSDKVGQVYRRSRRIARLQTIGDQLVREIEAKLPPADQRPRVGLVFYGHGRFMPYSLLRGGFGQAQYRAVGARDAFESIRATTYGEAGGRGVALDLEGLLALDPDVLIVPFAIYSSARGATTSRSSYEQLLLLKDDPLGQHLKALRTGRAYPGGTPLQGPIFHLFQIEMAAKQIYPDIFGPYRDDQRYPPREHLFDRARVAETLNACNEEEPDHS